GKNFKLIKNISKLEKSNFKDKLLFSKLITALEEAKSNKEREIFEKFFNQINNNRHQKFLNYKFKMLQKIGKGNLAYNIKGLDIDGKLHSLEELKGKIVVLDFWATWCGPCLYEAPYFDQLALKYKNDQVVFLSISIDENKPKWIAKVKSNPSKVQNWIALNVNEIAENYQISGIPRFVVIDKAGNFYESQMARPSEKSFETILNIALGKKNEE
ncbi:MAG: TlpA family protein disulfide reductase, partial [Flavobacterium sp.]